MFTHVTSESAPQPPPPRRPRPSTPPHIRAAAQRRAHATRGENRVERRRSAVRAGGTLGLRVAARRTARGRSWRAGAGPSVPTRSRDGHLVGGVEEGVAGVRQARRRLGTSLLSDRLSWSACGPNGLSRFLFPCSPAVSPSLLAWCSAGLMRHPVWLL